MTAEAIEETYISLVQAARVLGVSTKTVRRYIQAGYLEAGTLPGGSIRLSRLQVVDCVKPLPKKEC